MSYLSGCNEGKLTKMLQSVHRFDVTLCLSVGAAAELERALK